MIYLFQSGAPSQLETFDYKPELASRFGTELPDSIRQGQRLTGMTANQQSFPIAPSKFPFRQYGDCGTWVSSLLPHTAKVVDDLCVVNSMYTEAINHDPAITLMQTGSQQPGRASMGAWVSYGLGTDNENLPTFTVLISQTRGKPNPQGLLSRLWTQRLPPVPAPGREVPQRRRPGALPLRSARDRSAAATRHMLDGIGQLNELRPRGDRRSGNRDAHRPVRDGLPHADVGSRADRPVGRDRGDASICTAPRRREPGTFARNCLLARRLAERGVRFIQLYHRGWDQHGNLPQEIAVLVPRDRSAGRRP